MKILVIGQTDYTLAVVQTLAEYGPAAAILWPKRTAHLFRTLFQNTLPDPHFFYETLSDARTLSFIKAYNPDVILSCGLSDKIPDSIIELAQYEALNLHPSLLPDLKGPNPWYWTIRLGHTQSGVTLHRLTSTWDAGPIAKQLRFDVSPVETRYSLYQKSKQCVRQLIRNCLESFESKSLTFTEQVDDGSSYSNPNDSDFLISVTEPATAISNQVRAANPGIPCLAKTPTLSLCLREVDVLDSRHCSPGQFRVIDGKLLLGCSDRDLAIGIVEDKSVGIISAQHLLQLFDLSSLGR